MKKLFLVIIFFLVSLALPAVALGEGEAQESITEFESRIVIHPNATADITETINYNFGSAQKHGIFREIPYIIKNQDGKRFKLDLKVLSVSDKYQVSTSGDSISIKIGDANKFVTGEKVYKINYTVKGALRYFSEHDEFYWNVNGTDWQIPIQKVSATITLPQTSINKTTCYTGVYGSTQKNCQQNFDKNIAQFSAQNFSSGENLSIVVSFPKNVVAVVEPKEDKPGLLAAIISALFALGIFVWYVVLPFYIIYRWFKYGRDPKTNPNIPENFDPPKNKNGDKLLPAEVGTLVDESTDNRDISATILDLAIKGYLKIKEEKKGEYTLIKTKNYDRNLPLEKSILDGLFSEKDTITTTALKNSFYNTANSVKEDLYKSLTSEGFFVSNPKTTREKYYVLAAFALFTMNIFLALVSFLFGKNMPRKTPFGAQANIIALGLKKFLSSQERQLEFQSKNWFFFEKLLPYAIVFGVEKIWAERFKDIHVTPPDWYQGSDLSNFNTIVFINSLDNSLNSFERVSTPMTETRSSSGFSSGFSGGGSSGGGGGGGGGGSW